MDWKQVSIGVLTGVILTGFFGGLTLWKDVELLKDNYESDLPRIALKSELEKYALKTNIPVVPATLDLSGYALVEDIPNIPVMSEYVLRSEYLRSVIPRGAIVALSAPCGEGWSDFKLGNNRTLIGTSIPKQALTQGGRSAVTLSEKNIPQHRHAVHDTNFLQTTKTGDYSSDEYGKRKNNLGNTGYWGTASPAAIDITPLHVKVYFCQKK